MLVDAAALGLLPASCVWLCFVLDSGRQSKCPAPVRSKGTRYHINQERRSRHASAGTRRCCNRGTCEAATQGSSRRPTVATRCQERRSAKGAQAAKGTQATGCSASGGHLLCSSDGGGGPRNADGSAVRGLFGVHCYCGGDRGMGGSAHALAVGSEALGAASGLYPTPRQVSSMRGTVVLDGRGPSRVHQAVV